MALDFKQTLLNQMKEYLDGNITKEEYYEISEAFYTKYAHTYDNPLFHKYFLNTVADACLIYIDEPGLTPEMREAEFYKSLSDAYINLQNL
ncbi:MAG: hypothetical protein MR355_05705 [Lachnospiraceae bacterium]|nr:hypothetical protein [Lachnospiraceae bacterium]